jgi:mannosyltransferase
VSSIVNPLIILTNFHSRFTGVSATITNLAERHEQQYDVVILGKRLPVSTRQIGRWQLLRLFWNNGYRKLSIWHARRNSEMFLGIIAKYLFRVPLRLVFTTVALRRHSIFPRLLLSKMDAIIATTPEASSFVDRCDAIIPHGINTEVFTPPEDKLAAWRQSGLPGKYGIGIFGRIRAEKGTDLFIEAMCQLLPRYPDFTAIVAGHCKPKDLPFKEELKRKLSNAGVENRVIWLGQVSAEERHLWFQRIVLCIAPPRYEGFGLTPVEAMSCGAAVVATRTGVFPTLIEEGETGHVVDIGDTKSLVNAVDNCLIDPVQTMRKGNLGREHVCRYYDIRQEAASIEAVYEKILITTSSH